MGLRVQYPVENTVPIVQTQAALGAIGVLHRYAAEQLVVTLAYTSDLARTGAGRTYLTPTQTLMLDQLNRSLIWGLLTIIQRGGENIIVTLRYQAPPGQIQLEIQRQIDQLIHLYVQHVHSMFRR